MNPLLNLFDAACCVGRHLKLQEGGPHSAADLLAEMDHCGVAEALVLDSLARENHPADGNARILETVKPLPRLHAAWAALPTGAPDDQPAGEDWLATLRRHQVGAVHLLPARYRYNLSAWCIDALLEPLAAARVPVFICNDDVGDLLQDQTDWEAVVALCRRWPALPVIVSETRIRRSQRVVYRALEACDNLRIELSGFFLHRGIEFVTRHWGARRLIYGSNWPLYPMGQTLATLARAEIADADKQAIAGENLRELLAWSPPARQLQPVTLSPPADRYVAIGRGAPVPDDLRFWDCHGHLGGKCNHYHIVDGDLDATVNEMDRQGVEKVCVFTIAGVFSDEVHGNDVIADAVQRYPDRFVGFTLVNPHRGRDAMLHELERGARRGLRGIKLIPHYQGYPADGPLLDVACQWAHERRQIILNHSWGPDNGPIDRLTAQYPNACFVNGHTFEDYAEVVKKRDNLFICSCPLWDGPRHCERLVATLGADKLLFGSDLQDLPIAWGLGPILFAHLSAADKSLILGGNLKRILATYSLTP